MEVSNTMWSIWKYHTPCDSILRYHTPKSFHLAWNNTKATIVFHANYAINALGPFNHPLSSIIAHLNSPRSQKLSKVTEGIPGKSQVSVHCSGTVDLIHGIIDQLRFWTKLHLFELVLSFCVCMALWVHCTVLEPCSTTQLLCIPYRCVTEMEVVDMKIFGAANYENHYCDVIMGAITSRVLNGLFRRRSKKTSKLRVTGLCVGNSPVTDEFPTQNASNAGNVSIWWRQKDNISVPLFFLLMPLRIIWYISVWLHDCPCAGEIILNHMGKINHYLTTTKHSKVGS